MKSLLRQLPLRFSDDLSLSVLNVPGDIRLERLPTNTTTHQHPIHRWFNFITGFSPEFVDIICDRLSARETSQLILDPFSGCGTAPLEAALNGIHSIAYEAHPVFARISRAKLVTPESIYYLPRIFDVLERGISAPVSLATLPEASRRYLQKLFTNETLEQLLGMRAALESTDLIENDLAFLILSKTLDLSSHSATDGIYKAPTTIKNNSSPAHALKTITHTIASDICLLNGGHLSDFVYIYGKSSESMPELSDHTVSAVITSPPYLNNFDYAEMTRMYLYFWGIASTWSEITDRVRCNLIVNTTTALKGHRNNQSQYRQEVGIKHQNCIDSIVQQLAGKKKTKAGKKDYDLIVYPYFAQMKRVLKECYRVMAPDASFYMMVSDAALYGIHIPTPQILVSILDELGFSDTACQFIRKRGHRWILNKREGSKNGLGEYCVTAKR